MKIPLTSIYVAAVAAALSIYTGVLEFQERLQIPEASLAIVVSPEEPKGTALLLEPNDNRIAARSQEFRGVELRQEPVTTEIGTQE